MKRAARSKEPAIRRVISILLVFMLLIGTTGLANSVRATGDEGEPSEEIVFENPAEGTEDSDGEEESAQQPEENPEPAQSENENPSEPTQENASQEVEQGESAGTSEGEAPKQEEPVWKAKHFEGGANGIHVIVDAPEGALPEGTTMVVTAVDENSYLDSASAALNERIASASAVKVSFYDVDGALVLPRIPVQTVLSSDLGEDARLFYIDEADQANWMEQGAGAAFYMQEYSVYLLAATKKLVATTITGEGKTLTVTVGLDGREELPEDAKLEVTELTEGDEGWGDRSARFAGVLCEKYGNVTISDTRFLKIRITVDGIDFQPKTPVQLKIEYTDGLYAENTQETFEDPMLPAPIEPDGEGHFVMVQYADGRGSLLGTDVMQSGEYIVQSEATTYYSTEYDVGYVYEYNAPEAGSDSYLGTIRGADQAKEAAGKLFAAAAPLRASRGTAQILRAEPDGTPSIDKQLADNHDGTYQLGLSVTGDAV